jgi:hypothetical protein
MGLLQWFKRDVCDHRYVMKEPKVLSVRRGSVSGLRYEKVIESRVCDFCGSEVGSYIGERYVEDEECRRLKRAASEAPSEARSEGSL